MRPPLKHITIFGVLPALTACGQSDRDFYADPRGVDSTAASAASTGVAATGNMSSSAGGMTSNSSDAGTEGAATSSTANGGDGANTASGSGGSSGTGNNSQTSTTSNVNEPECPELPPEATSACLAMVGLSCTYDEITCVCSGITWNCVGGDSEGAPGARAGTAGSLITAGAFGSMGATTGRETTTNGSESRLR